MRHAAIEIITELGVERLCWKCDHFWPLDFFASNWRCFRGRTHECNACREQRRKPRRFVETMRRKLSRQARRRAEATAGTGRGASTA